jgi:hypothetical protein
VAIQAIEPDLLAPEQVGARPPALRHPRLEQLRLLRQLLPASRFRGGALRGGLVRPVLKGLDIRREGGGPHRLGGAGQTVMLLRAAVGQPAPQAGDLGRDVGCRLRVNGNGRPQEREREALHGE